MNMIAPKKLGFTLVFLCALSGQAAVIVDFDADAISTSVSKNSDFLFGENSATLDSTSSPGYTGQPVFGGFEREGNSFWSANDRSNAGLKVRWNGDAGVAGEASSGLYLFRQAEFLNGMDFGTIDMDAANDTVSGTAGYINPGDGVANPAIASSTIRFVLKDSAGYHISDAQPLISNTPFTFEAMSLSYSVFTPTAKTATEAGTVGAASVPTFSGITWVGFRIDAVRGSKVSQGANIGVELFSVQAASASAGALALVDGGLRHQKIEGFGASGAFWTDRLIDNVHASELADLLFRDLGLDIFRIQNVYNHNGYVSEVNDTVSTIQLGEAALGRPLKILMSSWTPPAYLKSTGYESGAFDATLATDADGYRYDDFAVWWADSLDYYSAQGIDPDYISIQNEPNWYPDYNGCGFDPAETTNFAGYNMAFDAVWLELAQRQGTIEMPKMLGPETIGFNKLDNYIDQLVIPSRAYGYAHHYYQNDVGENPDALNAQMAAFNADYGYKPLFQAEYAVLDANTNSPLARKLNLAKLMHNALTIEEVSAYFYWALYWNGEQGLIDILDSSTYNITPEYYAFKHFSAFVHAGWRRLEAETGVSSLSISAFASPDRDKLSLIVINNGNAVENLDLMFDNVTVTTGTVYQSTAVLDCERVGSYTPGASISIPAESITTVSLATVAPNAPENPNILMIAVDDLLPQLRCYGSSQMITPNIDQLASDGYQFNRAYVQQAVCGPSRASIMTGLRPDTTLVYEYNGDFRTTIPWAYTMPMVLSQQGYHSVGIGKIYHGGTNDELSWDEPWSAGTGRYGSTGNYPYENTTANDSTLRDGAVTDAVITKLAQLKNQQPFFYGVGYVRPHLPFVAPSKYWDLYDVADLEFPATDLPAINSSSYAYTAWDELRSYTGIPASGPVSASQEQNLIHGYYACVSFIDAQIGRLMDALETQGLAENTIIVVWGDHGWHLGDHGQWCKHTNFERATRIPLIVKVPWMPGASRVDALVEALDIFPTIIDLCCVEPPDHLQGESLVSLLENPDATGPAEAVSQYPRGSNESIMGYAMRTDRYRYVEWRAAGSDTPDDVELYDHFLDPEENTNVVASTDPTVVAGLSSQLDSYIDDPYRETTIVPGAQLITNGEFDDGVTGWTLQGQSEGLANFNPLTSDGSNGLGDDALLHLDPIVAGNIWDLALQQITGISSFKQYTISISARAQTTRNIKIIWRNKDNAVGSYFDSGLFSISSTAQTYTFSDVSPASLSGTDPDAEIRIQFGNASADVWIDSIEVHEEGGGGASFAEVLANAGLTGEDALVYADADGDGVNNLYEYACNMDMTKNDYGILQPGSGISGLPSLRVGATNGYHALEVEYLCRRNAKELQYVCEFSGNLVSNVWGFGLDPNVSSIDSAWDRVTVQDSETSETATNRFGRVRILFTP